MMDKNGNIIKTSKRGVGKDNNRNWSNGLTLRENGMDTTMDIITVLVGIITLRVRRCNRQGAFHRASQKITIVDIQTHIKFQVKRYIKQD